MNLHVKAAKGAVFSMKGCKDISIEKTLCPDNASPFMEVEGEKNSNIQLIGLDLKAAKTEIEFSHNAQPSAVIRR